MSVAYDRAFLNPVRKVYYNISITGLSVAVAFLVGTIELVSVLHDDAGWVNPVTAWISGIDLNNIGFIVVGELRRMGQRFIARRDPRAAAKPRLALRAPLKYVQIFLSQVSGL